MHNNHVKEYEPNLINIVCPLSIASASMDLSLCRSDCMFYSAGKCIMVTACKDLATIVKTITENKKES